MPKTPITSPTDIERALEAFIVPRIAALRKTARQKDLRFIFANPALTVAVYDGVLLEKIGASKFRFESPVHVELRFSDARSEEARRDGINPLVFAVIRTLSRQDFGLAISGLIPRRFRDVTTETDFNQFLVVYDIEFSTRYTIEALEEEDIEDLLAVSLKYFLQPNDDGLEDAENLVRFDPEAP